MNETLSGLWSYMCNNKLRACCYIIAMLILGVFSCFVGGEMPYAKQAEYLSRITTISSIIFGVTGAWLAITYPKALSSSSSARTATAAQRNRAIELMTDDKKLLEGFTVTLLVSVAVLFASITIPFIRDLLAYLTFFHSYTTAFRRLLFFTILILSYAQIYLLFMTIKGTKSALEQIDSNSVMAHIRNARGRNRTRP